MSDNLADAEEYARWFAVHEEPKLARLMTVLLAEYDRQRVALARIAAMHHRTYENRLTGGFGDYCPECEERFDWPCSTYELAAALRPDTEETGR